MVHLEKCCPLLFLQPKKPTKTLLTQTKYFVFRRKNRWCALFQEVDVPCIDDRTLIYLCSSSEAHLYKLVLTVSLWYVLMYIYTIYVYIEYKPHVYVHWPRPVANRGYEWARIWWFFFRAIQLRSRQCDSARHAASRQRHLRQCLSVCPHGPAPSRNLTAPPVVKYSAQHRLFFHCLILLVSVGCINASIGYTHTHTYIYICSGEDLGHRWHHLSSL